MQKTVCFPILVFLFVSCQNRGPEQTDVRPNILYIFTDQQTMNTMSCMGNPYVHTPHMDRLAEEGVMFMNSYCTSPVCGPSRSSMLTGCMPHETGRNINDNTTIPDPDLPNMGKLFRAAGYETKWAGKWHMPESYPIRKHRHQTFEVPGFDLIPFYEYEDPQAPWGYGKDTDGPLADAVIEYLKVDHEQPFLLVVSPHNPHDICFIVDRWDAYGSFMDGIPMDSLPPLPDNFEVIENEPDMIRVCREKTIYNGAVRLARDFDELRWRNYIYNYYRLTEMVDAEIGRILQALDENGLTENTLIVFSSDHGDGNGSHQWVQKVCSYEESTSVPFIVSWRNVTPGGVKDKTHIVSGIDILPTLCDYAGIPIPHRITGMSVKPIIDDPDTEWRKFAVTELQPFNRFPDIKARSIRTLQYKYTLFSHGEKYEQMFDMQNDPGEMNDLASDPGYQDVLEEHRELLNRWMRQTNDDFRQLSMQPFTLEGQKLY
ncbi:MAG: sulfatase-like hydrolase/transferase [Bacteroidales bacterium]